MPNKPTQLFASGLREHSEHAALHTGNESTDWMDEIHAFTVYGQPTKIQ